MLKQDDNPVIGTPVVELDIKPDPNFRPVRAIRKPKIGRVGVPK